MDSLIDLCFLCTKDYNCVPIDEKIVSQVEYLIPEITIIKLGVRLRICSSCDEALCAFNKFKESSVESSRRIEASINSLHTESNSLFYDDETKIEITDESFWEDYLDDTPLDIRAQINKMSLHPIVIVPHYRFSTNPNLETTNQFIKQEPIYENTLEFVNNNVLNSKLKEECINIETDNIEDDSICNTNQDVLEASFVDSEETYSNKNTNKRKRKLKNKRNQEILDGSFVNSEETYSNKNTNKRKRKLKNKRNQEILDGSFVDSEENYSNKNTNKRKRKLKNKRNQEILDGSFVNSEETSNKTINKHNPQIKNIEEKKEFQCHLCSELFIYKAFLARHMKKSHSRFKLQPCKICKTVFIHKYSLNKHLEMHNGIKNFPCFLCKKRFVKNRNLKQHIVRHNELKNKCDSEKLFPCFMCNKTFKTKKYAQNDHKKYCIKSQVKQKNTEKTFVCEICDKVYDRNYYTSHMRFHSGEKKFICNTCGSSFYYKCHLNRHIKTVHTARKEFLCKFCGREFKRKDNLTVHLRTHSKIKVFPCSFCDRIFQTSYNLMAHLNIHCRYQCTICREVFSYNTELNSHLETHYEVKYFGEKSEENYFGVKVT